MDECERRRISISNSASKEQDPYTDSTATQELPAATVKQPNTGYIGSNHTTNTAVPKRLLLRRSTARPVSYAVAASDNASSSPSAVHFSMSTPRLRPHSTSPPASPRLVAPLPPPPPPPPATSPCPPLLQVERVPRISQPQSFFKLGTIIEAPLMEEDFMYGASLHRAAAGRGGSSSSSTKAHGDRFSISASHYGYIHTKLRKFVVVVLFAQHYVAVPMYTHNGEGLEKKPDRSEFVSVRDARSGVVGGAVLAEGLSDHRVLVAEMRPEAMRLYEKTTVHFAYAVSRGYALKVTYLGELERGSRQKLLGLYREYMISGMVDLE